MENLLTNKFLATDFFHFFCGDQIGNRGKDRIVYEFKYDPTLVVKVDTGCNFANVEEWRVWHSVLKDRPELTKFFAPCRQISACGKVMLQVRTNPIKEDVELYIPDFMWDIKKENWGMFGSQLVCHDYANNIFHRTLKTEIVKASFYE